MVSHCHQTVHTCLFSLNYFPSCCMMIWNIYLLHVSNAIERVTGEKAVVCVIVISDEKMRFHFIACLQTIQFFLSCQLLSFFFFWFGWKQMNGINTIQYFSFALFDSLTMDFSLKQQQQQQQHKNENDWIDKNLIKNPVWILGLIFIVSFNFDLFRILGSRILRKTHWLPSFVFPFYIFLFVIKYSHDERNGCAQHNRSILFFFLYFCLCVCVCMMK